MSAFRKTDKNRAKSELAEQKSQYLLLAADFDHFKKRTRRDAEQQAAVEKEAFIRELLPLLDNLERALTAHQTSAGDPLLQGVEMTRQQICQLLKRHGIETGEEVGQPFNPHRHEAIATRHDPRQPDQIVLEVTQRGYFNGEKVFRPASVIVNDLSKPSKFSHAR